MLAGTLALVPIVIAIKATSDFQGAGFYVDATTPAWKENYQMYSYVTSELPEIVNQVNMYM
jgi:S-formylglutathione hydrolase FrmB